MKSRGLLIALALSMIAVFQLQPLLSHRYHPGSLCSLRLASVLSVSSIPLSYDDIQADMDSLAPPLSLGTRAWFDHQLHTLKGMPTFSLLGAVLEGVGAASVPWTVLLLSLLSACGALIAHRMPGLSRTADSGLLVVLAFTTVLAARTLKYPFLVPFVSGNPGSPTYWVNGLPAAALFLAGTLAHADRRRRAAWGCFVASAAMNPLPTAAATGLFLALSAAPSFRRSTTLALGAGITAAAAAFKARALALPPEDITFFLMNGSDFSPVFQLVVWTAWSVALFGMATWGSDPARPGATRSRVRFLLVSGAMVLGLNLLQPNPTAMEPRLVALQYLSAALLPMVSIFLAYEALGALRGCVDDSRFFRVAGVVLLTLGGATSARWSTSGLAEVFDPEAYRAPPLTLKADARMYENEALYFCGIAEGASPQ